MTNDQRVEQLTTTLINSNATINKVLEACRRIQKQWIPPTEKPEQPNENDD